MNKKSKRGWGNKEKKRQGEREWEPEKMRKGGKRKEEKEQDEKKEERNRGRVLLKSVTLSVSGTCLENPKTAGKNVSCTDTMENN